MNAILVPLNSLQAPLAGDILGGGAEILSILGISITVGMLLGSVTYPMVQRIIPGKGLWIASGLGIALFYIMLPVCRPLYTSRILVCAFTAVFSFILGYTVALVNSAFECVCSKKNPHRLPCQNIRHYNCGRCSIHACGIVSGEYRCCICGYISNIYYFRCAGTDCDCVHDFFQNTWTRGN